MQCVRPEKRGYVYYRVMQLINVVVNCISCIRYCTSYIALPFHPNQVNRRFYSEKCQTEDWAHHYMHFCKERQQKRKEKKEGKLKKENK